MPLLEWLFLCLMVVACLALAYASIAHWEWLGQRRHRVCPCFPSLVRIGETSRPLGRVEASSLFATRVRNISGVSFFRCFIFGGRSILGLGVLLKVKVVTECVDVWSWPSYWDLALESCASFQAAVEHRLICLGSSVSCDLGFSSVWAPSCQDSVPGGRVGVGVVSLHGAPVFLRPFALRNSRSSLGWVGLLELQRRRHQEDDLERRAGRALSLVQMGELSAGRQALERAPVAPGNRETLNQLRDPVRRLPEIPSQQQSSSSCLTGASLSKKRRLRRICVHPGKGQLPDRRE